MCVELSLRIMSILVPANLIEIICVLTWLLCTQILVSPMRLNIITAYTGQNPVYGYVSTGPGAIAGLEKAAVMYPEVFRKYTLYTVYSHGGIISCADAAIQMGFLAGNITDILERNTGFTIIYTPGCSLETMALGDFAREWNLPLLSNVAGDSRISNKQRFPTVLTGAGPDHTSMNMALLDLLDLLYWRTVTLLCDSVSQYPGPNTFFITSCANLRAQQTLRRAKLYLHNIDFDSKFVQDFGPFLSQAKGQSRSLSS
ncbi:hypothetical protein RvY_04580-4 [Ramazzottius varieornatus]|uniref:Receptor ligand binding region domain-containing protein n=1 Tax=Ramazzottius varieornatus TaxID=947166 RepID=A0A1D1UVM5_RAMVA|nr:hypothetical protein RvY_04580-4 [Ramazzottius varieornatus]